MLAFERDPSPHRWYHIRKLPLNPGIRTLDQYEEAVMLGILDAVAYLRRIQTLRALTVSDVQQGHYQMFKDVHPWAGQFRSRGKLATVAGFPAAESPRIARELELALFQTRELLEIAVSKHDSRQMVAALAFFHIRFERAHPFLNGNGRSGRAILAMQFEKTFGTSPRFTDQPGYRDAMRASARRDLAPLMNYLGASVGAPNITTVWPAPFQISPRFLEDTDASPTFEEDLAWSRMVS